MGFSDMAYSLLGLLDINMPLLYGEGGLKAFKRLQQIFIQEYDDESIFVFRDLDCEDVHNISSALAWSPQQFLGFGDIAIAPDNRRPPWTVTNKGLTFEEPMALPINVTSDDMPRRPFIAHSQRYLVRLHCKRTRDHIPGVKEVNRLELGPGTMVALMGNQFVMLLHEYENGFAFRESFDDDWTDSGRYEIDHDRARNKQFNIRSRLELLEFVITRMYVEGS